MLRRVLWLGLSASLAGCGWQKTQSGCAEGAGLSSAPYNGSQLTEKTIALTFNDGPSEFTSEVSDFLFANNIQATFFVTGKRIVEHKAAMQNLRNRGHLVGNLTYSYADLTKSPDPVLEVRKTDELITPYVTGNMFILRAPEDAFNTKTAQTLNDAGLGKYVGPIQFDIGTSNVTTLPDGTEEPDTSDRIDFMNDIDCWRANLAPETCANSYMQRIRLDKKGIVLMHDNTSNTLQMVKLVIPMLVNEGFTFTRIDDVPFVRVELQKNGGKPGTVGGPAACNDYK